MNMKEAIGVVACLVVLGVMSGCVTERERTADGALVPLAGEVKTDNDNFTVGLLFTHDGYSIYRFYDGITAVYYAVPASSQAEKTISVMSRWMQPQGKTSVERKLFSTTVLESER